MAQSKPKVLFVTTEYAPFSKVGGLGDVSGSLPKALRRIGAEARVVTPAWPGVMEKVAAAGLKTTFLPLPVNVSYAWRVHQASIIQVEVEGVQVYFLQAEEYEGAMYPDLLSFESVRPFAIFCMQALELGEATGWTPDIYHCHDWTSAFLPCALKWHRHYRSRPEKSIITLHNVAHQGAFDKGAFIEESGLEGWSYGMSGLEFYGLVNLLKGAIIASDAITTVSPCYSHEIQTFESTQALAGVIYQNRHKLSGILNGIDTELWDPETDPMIPAHFSPEDMEGKAICRRALMKEAGFPEDSKKPLVVCVSRLVEQKGFNLILPALKQLASMDAHFIFLGSGHGWIENALEQEGKLHPDTFCFFKGYNEKLSHLIYAGGDIFLMPSIFEPCGLSQMISMRYGTVPVVREVGGLKDTVTDVDSPGGGNGFTFLTCDTQGMMWALGRAVSRFMDKPAWQKIVCKDMKENFTWDKSASLYVKLYSELMP